MSASLWDPQAVVARVILVTMLLLRLPALPSLLFRSGATCFGVRLAYKKPVVLSGLPSEAFSAPPSTQGVDFHTSQTREESMGQARVGEILPTSTWPNGLRADQCGSQKGVPLELPMTYGRTRSPSKPSMHRDPVLWLGSTVR